MKLNKILPVLAFAALTLLGIYAFKSRENKKSIPENGFALVELFTSEGCSSCPPADELVSRIIKEDKNKAVYVLGYHVDYWNHLGWRDEFSKAEYSERQRKYATYLHADVYTPQIVVNGKREFVGSSENSLRIAIQAGLRQTGIEPVALSDVHFSNSILSLQYQTKNTANRALLIAFVQNNARSNVKSGENGGHVLNHVNIVRYLESIKLNKTNSTENIKLPAGFSTQTWQVIGFVQNIATGEVLSAQRIMN
ncbi:MAG: DUF1223 domain-containing protein [Mucilaginibacter sp.]